MSKPYRCKVCGTEEPKRFWGRSKSLCNRCKSKPATKKYRSTEVGKLKHNASNEVYRLKNKDVYNALSHKRRARIKGVGGSHTAKDWKGLKEFYSNKCLACGCTECKLTKDHVVPISKGGNNSIHNIQPLCGICNSIKHDKIIDYRTVITVYK